MNTYLDHSGLVVSNLDGAARQLAALGFSLQPRSHHTVPNADGSLRLAGTANQCAMLERGYIELITVTDPTADSFSRTEIGGFLGRFEGLHLIAIGTGSARATEERLNTRDVAPLAMRALHRRIDLPEGLRDAGFHLIQVPEPSSPNIAFFFIEHLTPELLWRPNSMVHPNGAVSLYELVVVTDDMARARIIHEAVFGQVAIERDGGLCFPLDRSQFLVLTPEAAACHYGANLPGRALPHCAGQAVGVVKLSAAAAILEANGVPFTQVNERLTVGPQDACDGFLQFVEVGP